MVGPRWRVARGRHDLAGRRGVQHRGGAMRAGSAWRATSMAAAALATLAVSACVSGPCPESVPIESGEYTVVKRLHGDEGGSDGWLHAILPGAQLSIDRASDTATLVYEREGSTYQVVFTLEE